MLKMIMLVHLFLFVFMFVLKNIVLIKESGQSIIGKNTEAKISIVLFNITIFVAITSVLSEDFYNYFFPIGFPQKEIFVVMGILLLGLCLIISFLALLQMRDSWRVGIIEGDKTSLITGGIFSKTRNPYFISYILLFVGYIFLIPNLLVIILSLLSFVSIHKMILKEEQHLQSLHGTNYTDYKKRTPRYIIR